MNEDIQSIEQAGEERRFRAVAVDPRVLADVFKGNCYFKSDLPEDIKVYGVHRDHARLALIVTLVSIHFEPVPGHCEIPIESGLETFYLEHTNEED